MSKLLIPLFVSVLTWSCQRSITNSFTQKLEREQFIIEKTHFIDSVFQYLPDVKNEKKYQAAFWASELMLKKSPVDSVNLCFALAQFADYSDNFKFSLLQHIYTLYLGNFYNQIDSLIKLERDEKRFAIMANQLIRIDSANVDFTHSLMKKNFQHWNENPILKAFSESQVAIGLTKTQITDLFAFRANSKEVSFFVFLHKNRDIPGYLIIQKENGEVVIEKGDTLKFRLLARSITNLPEYITNGNTPQGVYSVQGFSVSDNIFIGKSSTIISTLPFETSLANFSFEKMNGDWTLEQYNQFFPKSWSNYLPKNRAFYAGKAGRSEIILHGTTIDTDFYKFQSYYPFTPSLGCLCLLERWDSINGNLIGSEQRRLIKTLKKYRISKAMMYVIEFKKT